MQKKRILQSKSGASLVLVICVMAVFTALSLSLLLSSATLIRNAQKAYWQEQVRIAAATLSNALKDNLDNQLAAPSGDEQLNSVCTYLHGSMKVFGGDWGYYNADEAGSYLNALTRTFNTQELLGSTNGIIQNASISMYWTSEAAIINNASLEDREKYESVSLVVIVECTSAEGESYRVQSAYGISCDEVENGNNGNGNGNNGNNGNNAAESELIAKWYSKGAEQ